MIESWSLATSQDDLPMQVENKRFVDAHTKWLLKAAQIIKFPHPFHSNANNGTFS